MGECLLCYDDDDDDTLNGLVPAMRLYKLSRFMHIAHNPRKRHLDQSETWKSRPIRYVYLFELKSYKNTVKIVKFIYAQEHLSENIHKFVLANSTFAR